MLELIKENCKWLLARVSQGFLPMEAYIENLYVRAVHNFGFSGDDIGLPIEVSLWLLELFVCLNDCQFTNLANLLVHALNIKRDYILQLDPSCTLFRYVSNGCFLTDCLIVDADYERLVEESILPTFDQLNDLEQVFANEFEEVKGPRAASQRVQVPSLRA